MKINQTLTRAAFEGGAGSFVRSVIASVFKVSGLLLLVFLSACASRQPAPQPGMSIEQPTTQARADGSIRFDTDNEQVARLWLAAEKARLEDRQTIALELIFDALELSPANSVLWSRAAELQLDNLEAALAENYAVKSNSFAGNNKALLYRNWLIIEHARNMRGDLLGARNAKKTAQQHLYQ